MRDEQDSKISVDIERRIKIETVSVLTDSSSLQIPGSLILVLQNGLHPFKPVKNSNRFELNWLKTNQFDFKPVRIKNYRFSVKCRWSFKPDFLIIFRTILQFVDKANI